MKNTNKTLNNIVLTALFAAMTTLTTAYILHIPVGTNGGYIHIGDAVIYLAACFLPTPYAICAGAIGGGLADFISPGGQVWVLPTVIIKSIITLPFSSKDKNKIVTKRNIVAIFIAACVTIGGYYVAEALLISNSWITPIASLVPNLIQAAGSAVVFLVIGFALDKADIKNKLKKINN